MGRAGRQHAGPGADPSAVDRDLLEVVRLLVRSSPRRGEADDVRHQLHRADALRRVAGDIGNRLDLDQILSGLVDHAMVLFEADRGAVFLRQPNGEAVAGVSRGLSQAYLQSVRGFPVRSLPSLAIAARRPLFAGGYSDDPRGEDVRAAVVQEGYDTICTAPLFDGPDVLGLLNVYHDTPHAWTDDELETMAALRRRHRSRSRTPRTTRRWRPGPPSVDPAARSAVAPDQRPRDRAGDRPSFGRSSTTTTSGCTASSATT